MGEVEDLETKLKQAGHPIRKEYSDIFLQNVQTKPTPAERIPKWMNQIQILRQRLETVSVVAHPKRKAPDSRPEPAIQSHEAKVAAEQKRPKKWHNYVYTEYDDGSPPIMCPLHVDFIRMSVDELKKDRDQYLQVQDLLATWNASKRHEHGGKKLTRSLFNNHYISLALLRRISSGSLPLPVPYEAWPSGRKKPEDDCARAQNADGVMRKRGRPPMRAGESDR